MTGLNFTKVEFTGEQWKEVEAKFQNLETTLFNIQNFFNKLSTIITIEGDMNAIANNKSYNISINKGTVNDKVTLTIA